jgi:hypothetical protein
VTTSTYVPPFLQSPGGQQALPWQQGTYGQPGQFTPTGFEQLSQFGPGQQSFGTPFGSQAPSVEQILPSIQVIVQLLGNAQQAIWTAQHVLAQLPPYIATMLQQPYHQLGQRQFARPYSTAW